MMGAHFGLTPKKYQSGETDVTRRISKIGDHGVRVALYEAANVMLTAGARCSVWRSAPPRPNRSERRPAQAHAAWPARRQVGCL